MERLRSVAYGDRILWQRVLDRPRKDADVAADTPVRRCRRNVGAVLNVAGEYGHIACSHFWAKGLPVRDVKFDSRRIHVGNDLWGR
jgi:hypothetical protein